VAEAYRDAQKIKGDGDAQATAIYAEAFGQNPEFYAFYRSLDAYREELQEQERSDGHRTGFRILQIHEGCRPRKRQGQMTSTLLLAFALMLVLEGLMPFIAPAAWRETFRRLVQLSDGQIRFIGLTSMIIGLVLLMVFS
jgi:uncharacterized protein YjeT (DUF2065 family)